MGKEITWSHSRLNTILEDPRRYYLQYIVGLSPNKPRSALSVGSAFHWLVEHGIEDLTNYVDEFGSWSDKATYGKDQLLPEAMAHGYFLKKEEMFDQLLTDENGNKLKLAQEFHEIELTCEVPSHKYPFNHKFLGIIDLLLVTDKGFVLVDYKTSSQEPDFDKYLEQIYRYIMLLRANFPGVPIHRIGIINVKKSMIRQKQNENNDSFLMRLKQEYDVNVDNYVNAHIYNPEELDKDLLDKYINNLSDTLDFAQMIVDNEAWFINYGNAKTVYGKSDFYDIYYNMPNAYAGFKIRDCVYDDFEGIKKSRDAREIDVTDIFNKKKINNYYKFKEALETTAETDKEKITSWLKENYVTDDYLLKKYWETKEIEDTTIKNEEI